MPDHDAMLQALNTAPFVPVKIVSSDLPRCSKLAMDLAEFWGCDLTLSSQLREMSFGEWDGLSYQEIDEKDSVRWRAWCDDWLSQAPPNGESIEQFSLRITNFLSLNQPCDHTVLITHAGVIRALEVMAGKSWDLAMATQYPFLNWNQHEVKLINE